MAISRNPGEYAYFQVQIRNGDTITHSTRLQGAAPFPADTFSGQSSTRLSPVEDVLREMSVGDSVTVLIRFDYHARKTNGLGC